MVVARMCEARMPDDPPPHPPPPYHVSCCWLQELAVDGDQSCLFYVARALQQLQQQTGTIPHIKGEGRGRVSGVRWGGRQGVAGGVGALPTRLPPFPPILLSHPLLRPLSSDLPLPLPPPPPPAAGKGDAAAAVHRILSRLRREQGRDVPAVAAPGEGIDTMILLDRTVDMVTPMCTQVGAGGSEGWWRAVWR